MSKTVDQIHKDAEDTFKNCEHIKDELIEEILGTYYGKIKGYSENEYRLFIAKITLMLQSSINYELTCGIMHLDKYDS